MQSNNGEEAGYPTFSARRRPMGPVRQPIGQFSDNDVAEMFQDGPDQVLRQPKQANARANVLDLVISKEPHEVSTAASRLICRP
jgi:hypothetical protein